jgi:hypothetical protein
MSHSFIGSSNNHQKDSNALTPRKAKIKSSIGDGRTKGYSVNKI